MTANIKALAATGDVTTFGTYLKTVVLTAGEDAATLTVKAGGSGGTTVLVVNAAAAATTSVDLCGAYCPGGVHATLTGTGPSATFVYG